MSIWYAVGIDLIHPYKEQLVQKLYWIQAHIPDLLIARIGLYNLLDAPILAWKSRYMDSIGNISKIPHFDVQSPIMIGEDTNQRPFITIRTENNGHYYIDTIYKKDATIWIHTSSQYTSWIDCTNYRNALSNTIFLKRLTLLMKTHRIESNITSKKFTLC